MPAKLSGSGTVGARIASDATGRDRASCTQIPAASPDPVGGGLPGGSFR